MVLNKDPNMIFLDDKDQLKVIYETLGPNNQINIESLDTQNRKDYIISLQKANEGSMSTLKD